MQDQARVVIIGAGVVGCSVAYHLTRLGWRDIVVLEQGPLFDTGGSSSHAPAIIFQTNPSRLYSLLAAYTVELFSQLELDGLPCYFPVGALEVAWTPDRMEELKRRVTLAKSWGLDTHLLGPEEAVQKAPLLTDKVLGAMYNATDGLAKVVRADEAMANEAKAGGANFYGDTTVTGIEVKDGRVRAVVTSRGRIRTDIVVAAAGIWGPRVGQMAGVTIPLFPMQHPQIKLGPLPELADETVEITQPAIRHPDRSMYCRQYFKFYEVGSYRHEPVLFDPDDIPPYEQAKITPATAPFRPELFSEALAPVMDLVPALRDAPVVEDLNGMFSFTVDGMPILGESPQVRGFWSAEAVWAAHAGGVGKIMAEWIVEGTPSLDTHEADIARFHPHVSDSRYIRSRCAQQYREVYDIIHPLQQSELVRGLRTSPFYPRQKDLGAIFFETTGWERPQWYTANESLLQDMEWPARSGWEARGWSPIVYAEHRAARERVGMFDLTPFAKLEVTGTDALDSLQRITSNDLDWPPGKIIYTSMLTEQGGIKCDLTVTRLEADRFLIITGGGFAVHDLAWIRGHLFDGAAVGVADISSSMCCIGLWGPESRRVVQSVTEQDVSNEAFPYLTTQRLMIGGIPCLALRISYVGELGWEIYCPPEFGLRLWDVLWHAGETFGVTAVGGGAFDSLRLEKGYRLWGAEVHTEVNPYQAGLAFAVRPDKGEFIGREALQSVESKATGRRLTCITLDDPGAVVMGSEPILDGDNLLGYVTSAGYGYSVGRCIAYGYLLPEYAVEGKRVEIEYFGRRYEATVAREPLYDSEAARLKS